METPASAADQPTSSPSTPTLEQRLAFLNMTDRDREILRGIAPKLSDSSQEFVEAFYRHLFTFPDTARFLQDPATVARLKQAQQVHLLSMLEANIDEEYIARRRRVGDVHALIGISPQMFLGAYNQYLQHGLRLLAGDAETPAAEFLEQTLSLLKAIFLDIELTLDAYFSQATQHLRQALDMVFRANSELRQFAQLTSHDLKTPLATVANLCDEMLDEFREDMPAQAAELILAAKDRTYRMSRMIDELLEMSAPTEELEGNVEIDSQAVLAEARERLEPKLAQQQIKLEITPDLPKVWGNRVRLREAFYNVISNAVKYIDKRPGSINVSASTTPDACIFHVADNGPGIPREDLERIFSPFRRLRMHQHRPGTGLGLYFTKNLIEQQGGRVWADSELGRGSVFHLQLQRHAGPESRAAAS